MGVDLSGLIVEVLVELGVEWCLGCLVVVVDVEGVMFDDGQWIEVKIVVWIVGVWVSILIGQILGECDVQGCLYVDCNFKVFGFDDVYVIGDVVCVVIDDFGNYVLMICQYVIVLGCLVGNNVVVDLFGVELIFYSQVKYVICFDFGGWGVVFIEGWDCQVWFVCEEGKKIKIEINGVWIYLLVVDCVVVLVVVDLLILVVVQGDFFLF